MTGSIHVHIDSLLLEGFESRDPSRVSAALQTELSRLLHEHGLPHNLLHLRESNSLRLGPLNLAPGDPPETAGQRVAHAIYESLSRREKRT